MGTHMLENSDLHERLIIVCRLILDNFDCNRSLVGDILAFDDLAKGSMADQIDDPKPPKRAADSRWLRR
jgi:hypothetical protein